MHFQNQAIFTANLDSRPLFAGLVGKVESLDPALISTPEERLIASAIYEGMVYYDNKSNSVKPLLAKNIKYSSDGKIMTIHLKNKVKFHDGQKLTAKMVKESWEDSFRKSNDWASLSLFLNIQGVRDLIEGREEEIKGIELVNSNTLKIHFNKSNAAFKVALTHPLFWVKAKGENEGEYSGSGPFYLEKAEDEQYLLSNNNEYHGTKAYLSAINFKIFADEYEAFGEYKAGSMDYLSHLPLKEIKNIKENADYKDLFIDIPLLEIYSFGFHINKEPFADNYLLRRAINYAINREEIIDKVLGDSWLASKALIPVGLNAYNKELSGYSYNVDKAKEILGESGYLTAENLKPITLSHNKNEGHKQIAMMIAEDLGEIGIQTNIQELEWDYYQKQLSEMQLDFFRIGWEADYPDADNFLYTLFHSSNIGVSNYTAYFNPQVDKILDASRAEIKSESERMKLLQRVEEIIVDDAPFLCLFQKKSAILLGEQVEGLELDKMKMIDWKEVYLTINE